MGAIKDVDSGEYLWVAPSLSALLAPGSDGLQGATDAAWADPATAAALRAADQAAAARDDVLSSEHRVDIDGDRVDLLVLRLAGPADAQGRRQLASVWVDQRPVRQKDAQLRQAMDQIEQLQRANEALRLELKDQGLRDRDSGVFTRGHFEEQLRREVDLSTREHREFALVFIEIDAAADKVAALGEPAQRRILEAMGRLLRGNTRAMDASCRLEERRFAVLLSGVGLATAHARMEGLRRQCATQIVVLEGQDLGFTASMGVASFPHTAHSQEELVEACSAALAEAQRRGGNHVTLASIRFEP
jgi:diguanylate cyclase (GGDEF)-like protein